jgi:DNA polymerase-3 subunit epsilon
MKPADIGLAPTRPKTPPLPTSSLGADFVAIDFETANRNRSSACSIGVAVVKGGVVVDHGSTLIDPQADFDWYNTAINGLSSKDVNNAPRFDAIWPQLADLLRDKIVVAHSATFDIGVLRQSVARYELAGIDMQTMCSWRLAKMSWKEYPSYKLSYLCSELGLDLDHHEAGSDAAASAGIVLAAIRQAGASDLSDLYSRSGYHFGSLNPRSFVGLSFTPKDANLEADPDHPLFERTISFTGTMFSMTRDEAKDAIADVGATWREQPSNKVDMLVIGDADFVSFADGDRTSKLTKAINLKANGHQIEIMAESDFLALL